MREPDPFAWLILDARAAEQIEDPLMIPRFDATAVVGDFEDCARTFDPAAYLDPAPATRQHIFDRIFDNVAKDLLDGEPVADDAGQPGRDREIHLFLIQLVAVRVRDAPKNRIHVELFGRDLAALLFGAPAWRCAPRDRHLGWSQAQRAAGLAQLANNTRFLILPWVRIENLASHILGRMAARISEDWQQMYGHPIYFLETFVDSERFRGTCYRAANWQFLGLTTGRGKNDQTNKPNRPIKEILGLPLAPRFRQLLNQL